MDNQTELRKSFWVDAATAGGIIGLVLVVIEFINVQTTASWMVTFTFLLTILSLGYLIYFYSRKRSLKYGAEGYSYGQSMGYIFAMMLFAGFVLGLGELLLSKVIAPDYYAEERKAILENNPMYDPNTEMGKQMERMVMGTGFWIFSSIFSLLFYGGIIGLFASAMVKRKTDIFAE